MRLQYGLPMVLPIVQCTDAGGFEDDTGNESITMRQYNRSEF